MRLLATDWLLEFNRQSAVDVRIVAIFLAKLEDLRHPHICFTKDLRHPLYNLFNGLELVPEAAMS